MKLNALLLLTTLLLGGAGHSAVEEGASALFQTTGDLHFGALEPDQRQGDNDQPPVLLPSWTPHNRPIATARTFHPKDCDSAIGTVDGAHYIRGPPSHSAISIT